MPKPINFDDPIIALSSHLKNQSPDYFKKLNARARLTCERIADGVQLNWLDKLGAKVLQNQFNKPSKVWSLMTTALYKVTLFFHSIIYRNWQAPLGENIAAKFNPKSMPVSPSQNVSKPEEPEIPSNLNPAPTPNLSIPKPTRSGPIVEEVFNEDEGVSPEESVTEQAPQKFREAAQAIEAEANEEIDEEKAKVAKDRDEALAAAQEEEKMRAIAKEEENVDENITPSMITQLRSSIPGSLIDSAAVLSADLATEAEQSSEEVPEIASEVDPEEAARIEAKMEAQQERIDNFMRRKLEGDAQAKTQKETVSAESSDEEGLLITDEELAAL